MDARIKALWIAALRSGEYKQGKHQLRDGDRFCCLGVLCNIHAQEHPTVAAEQSDPDGYMDAVGTLPLEVHTWADLGAPNPIVAGQSISLWNDIRGADFNKIADLIEQHL